MEYLISMTPIKYHSAMTISLIFPFKMSLQCVNSDQDMQILHFVKELKGANVKTGNFFLVGKCPPPCAVTVYILPEKSYSYLD